MGGVEVGAGAQDGRVGGESAQRPSEGRHVGCCMRARTRRLQHAQAADGRGWRDGAARGGEELRGEGDGGGFDGRPNGLEDVCKWGGERRRRSARRGGGRGGGDPCVRPVLARPIRVHPCAMYPNALLVLGGELLERLEHSVVVRSEEPCATEGEEGREGQAALEAHLGVGAAEGRHGRAYETAHQAGGEREGRRSVAFGGANSIDREGCTCARGEEGGGHARDKRRGDLRGGVTRRAEEGAELGIRQEDEAQPLVEAEELRHARRGGGAEALGSRGACCEAHEGCEHLGRREEVWDAPIPHWSDGGGKDVLERLGGVMRPDAVLGSRCKGAKEGLAHHWRKSPW